jgi:phosphate transport system substrate-binding protein
VRGVKVLAGAILAVGVGCQGSSVEPGRPVVRITGSDTLVDHLIPALVAGYEKAAPEVQFELQNGGTRAGFKALLDGEADLGAASIGSTPAEQEQARVNGFKLEDPDSRHIVAVNVVAVAVHPSNPIESLTYDQVIGIFCTGSVDNWAFLGQDDMPIHAVTRDPTSGTRAVFEDFFCGPKGISPRVALMSVADIGKVLNEDPSAISFESLSEGAGKVIALRSDALGHPILPSQQNVIRGAYPLYNDEYLYSAGKPSPEVVAFLDWIGSPAGQDIVDEERFVPLFLRPTRMDEPRPLRETIHFEEGSKEPNQRSMARLKLLADELRERTGEARHVVLEGYTDSDEADALALAQARAEEVRDLLSSELPGAYFEIIPRGSVNPLAPNSTPYGRQQNRRVQIYLAEEEQPDHEPSEPR